MILNRKVLNIIKNRQKEIFKSLFLEKNEILELSFYNFLMKRKKMNTLDFKFSVVSKKNELVVSEKRYIIHSDDSEFEQIKKICSILEYMEYHYRYNILIDNTCQYHYNTIYCNGEELTDILDCFINLLKKDITRNEAKKIILKMFEV